MKKFLEEFKAFALKGNMMDMAIGVLIGGIHDRLRCENSGDHSGFGDNDSSRDDGGRDNNCGGDGWEGVPDQTACSIFKRLR